MATVRQQIIEMLRQKDRDAREISQHVSIREKEVYDHLPHIIRTLSSQKKKLTIFPAQCKSCDYEFKDREKTKKPGRCPVCKSERIDPPRFRIVESGDRVRGS
jgi:predicted Zn-ribbon and HTH transcriptional regulator